MSRSSSFYRRYLKASGVVLCGFGSFAVLYALCAVTIGFWSSYAALALFALWGLVCLTSGVVRLKKGHALFFFQKKGLNRCAQALFVLFCLCLVLLQSLVAWGTWQKPVPGAQAVVILGAKVYGDRPSLMLEKRIAAGADYLLANPDCVAVACGGGTGDYTEAYVIRKGLQARGVDASRIYLDETSADTRQNIQNAVQILDQAGDVRRIAIATSDYHLWRSARLVRLQGYEPVCMGADALWFLRPIAHFQEMLSIARDLLLRF